VEEDKLVKPEKKPKEKKPKYKKITYKHAILYWVFAAIFIAVLFIYWALWPPYLKEHFRPVENSSSQVG